mmetsp:Transcript_70504/g.127137  ORF Transcript_70504/g.127137 Transcript_70504/m.127137 type:complete len:202 (-) Transcript_70504:165-770(-)
MKHTVNIQWHALAYIPRGITTTTTTTTTNNNNNNSVLACIGLHRNVLLLVRIQGLRAAEKVALTPASVVVNEDWNELVADGGRHTVLETKPHVRNRLPIRSRPELEPEDVTGPWPCVLIEAVDANLLAVTQAQLLLLRRLINRQADGAQILVDFAHARNCLAGIKDPLHLLAFFVHLPQKRVEHSFHVILGVHAGVIRVLT